MVVAISLGLLLWAGTTAYRKSAKAGGGLMTALASNPAVRAIYGLPTAITTIGGFAVWRVELFVMLLGAVWMTLATTRVMRGDEENGRLDLVLANPLSLTRSTGASLLALLAVPFLAAVVVGAVLDGSGAQPAGSWLYGLGIGLLVATFLAVGALASQLVPERRRATGLAVGVVFATFILRMWADGSSSAGWARWLTPLGWVEDLHAFGGNELHPLVPLVLAPVVLVAVAFVVARRRDVGAGLIRADDRKEAGTALLSGPLAFAAHRRVGELAGWVAALAVLGVLSGGLAESLVGFPKSQPGATAMLNRMGMGAAVTPAGFVAIMNVFYAVVLAGYGIASVHDEPPRSAVLQPGDPHQVGGIDRRHHGGRPGSADGGAGLCDVGRLGRRSCGPDRRGLVRLGRQRAGRAHPVPWPGGAAPRAPALLGGVGHRDPGGRPLSGRSDRACAVLADLAGRPVALPPPRPGAGRTGRLDPTRRHPRDRPGRRRRRFGGLRPP